MNADGSWLARNDAGIVEFHSEQISMNPNKILPPKFQSSSELLAASVMRLEGLFRAENDPQTRSEVVSTYLSSDRILAPYAARAHGDPATAVALARADVEYWRSLRKSGWRTVEEKRQRTLSGSLKYIVAPLLFALLTGLLGHMIFQRQRFFDAKLQRLESGQRRAVTALTGIRTTADLLAGWEVYGGGLSPRGQLQEYKEELGQIKALGGGSQGSEQIATAADSALEEVNAYLACLEETPELERNAATTPRCTNRFELENFEALVVSFDEAINSLEGFRW